MNRTQRARLLDTDYPAVRRVMGSQRESLDDPDLEELLEEVFPGTEPEDVDNDMLRSPLGVPCTAPPWGTIDAIDLAAGEIRWSVPLGVARRPLS